MITFKKNDKYYNGIVYITGMIVVTLHSVVTRGRTLMPTQCWSCTRDASCGQTCRAVPRVREGAGGVPEGQGKTAVTRASRRYSRPSCAVRDTKQVREQEEERREQQEGTKKKS